ncbi:zinc finger, C2H2 type [Ancylostoma ceylanicum]|uniref:Zinc finger, C2H2 type n=1 Tax=Ancylostoma ceylanicum TaxID=53326 RepID=A0A0D6L799_9BILA|nr:zinc finger, C2H2 type [Ancylostoma ceylanicum]
MQSEQWINTGYRDVRVVPQYFMPPEVNNWEAAIQRVNRQIRSHSDYPLRAAIECTQCGKEFGTRQLLKKHWMWHTGERSHVCKHCNKAFFQFDLNRHMKIHAERGYSCRQCGRSFTRQQSLDEHALKCKAKSSGVATPPMKIEQPSPVFPLITQPLLNFNQENVAKMAQTLIAQQQQRTLAALLARQQAAQLPVQPAAAPPPPTPSIMPSLFCALCSKAFPNQPAFAVHMYMCHIQGNNVPVIGEETKMPVLAPVNPIRTDQEDAHINVLSSTATNSSCSSSPQETTSTAFTATSPSTTEEVGASPLNESLHSPPTAQNEIQTKPCTSCRLHAVRSSELEAALLAKGHELEKFKEMMRAVICFSNTFLSVHINFLISKMLLLKKKRKDEKNH